MFRKEHTFQQESNQSQSTKDRQSKESNVLGLKGKRKLFKNQNKKLRAFRYQRQVLRVGDCSVVEVLTTKPNGPSRSLRPTSESCPLSSAGMLWHAVDACTLQMCLKCQTLLTAHSKSRGCSWTDLRKNLQPSAEIITPCLHFLKL